MISRNGIILGPVVGAYQAETGFAGLAVWVNGAKLSHGLEHRVHQLVSDPAVDGWERDLDCHEVGEVNKLPSIILILDPSIDESMTH